MTLIEQDDRIKRLVADLAAMASPDRADAAGAMTRTLTEAVGRFGSALWQHGHAMGLEMGCPFTRLH